LGLNTALRVSDMLVLNWGDVFDFEEREFKSHVYITEQKTSKNKKFLLNNSAIEFLKRLKKELGKIKPKDYLFVSRQGDNKPVTRFMASKIVKSSCAAVRII
jgi:integrase